MKKIFKIFIPALILSLLGNNISCSRSDNSGNDSAPDTRELKVTTYNVHYFENGISGVKKTIYKIKPDIIALQEVLVNKNNPIEKLAEGLRYHHASSRSYVRYGDKYWVLSFLSVYPILKQDETSLGSRRAFRIVIDVKGTAVTLVTTHLSPFVWSDQDLLNANLKRSERRKGEVRMLSRWIGETKNLTILLGDLNSLSFLNEMEALYDAGFADVFYSAGLKTQGTFPLNKKLLRVIRKKFPYFQIPEILPFDYILLRGGIKTLSVKVDKSGASDHFPLSAVLSLPIPVADE